MFFFLLYLISMRWTYVDHMLFFLSTVRKQKDNFISCWRFTNILHSYLYLPTAETIKHWRVLTVIKMLTFLSIFCKIPTKDPLKHDNWKFKRVAVKKCFVGFIDIKFSVQNYFSPLLYKFALCNGSGQ